MKKQLQLVAALLITATTLFAQIPSYVPTNGLVGWWPFNGNANDESGNGNNGTVNGVTLTTDRNGNTGKAYSFDGINDYIFMGVIPSLTTSSNNGFTIALWFNSNSYQNSNSDLYDLRSNDNSSNQIYLNNNSTNGLITSQNFDFPTWQNTGGTQGGFSFNSNTNFIINNWTFVVYTQNYITNENKLFVNGVLSGSNVLQHISINNPNFNIGSRYSLLSSPIRCCNFSGILDDIGIWNRALTQQEVTNLYNTVNCNVTASISQTNLLCNGGSNGSTTVTPSGGTAPYTYSWAPAGGSAATASNLAAGTYTCIITDANQCNTTKTVTITQPNVLTTTSTQTNVLCNGGSTGSASVSVSGGTPVYTYSWTPSGGTGSSVSNLSAGNYTCTVRDANQCSTTKTVTITQPPAITSQIIKQDATCFGSNDGYAEIYPVNGQDPYSYLWQHDGSIDFFAANLSAGNYNCLITDANGCTHTETVTISQPNAILINLSPSINTIHSGNNAVFTASSAIPALSFQWQSNSNHTDWVNLSNNAFYNGVYSNNLTIYNVNVNNHTQLFRVVANDGTCSGTSNQAQLLVSDTCITTIVDTNYINQTIYDTTYVTVTDTNYVTVYDTVTTYISVTDTLFIDINTVGLNNNTIINTIKVFPNPANSFLNLDYGNYANLSGYSVKIVNALSQVIYNQPITQQSETIDLSTFGGNGIYYLNIINPQGNIVDVRKIVLN